MRNLSRLSPELVPLARRQEGVLTRRQLTGNGFARTEITRRLREQSWTLLSDGVYLTSTAPVTWHQRAWAGVLLGGAGALVAGRAAAHLFGLDRLPPETIDIAIPHQRRITDRPGLHFQRTRLMPTGNGRPPRLPLPRTVMDLVAHDPDQMIH